MAPKKVLLTEKRGSLLRTILRSGILCVTAFGLKWSPDRIAAVQLAAESVLTSLVHWNEV